MKHLIINIDSNDQILLNMEMSPIDFVETFVALMNNNEEFKALILASVECYNQQD